MLADSLTSSGHKVGRDDPDGERRGGITRVVASHTCDLLVLAGSHLEHDEAGLVGRRRRAACACANAHAPNRLTRGELLLQSNSYATDDYRPAHAPGCHPVEPRRPSALGLDAPITRQEAQPRSPAPAGSRLAPSPAQDQTMETQPRPRFNVDLDDTDTPLNAIDALALERFIDGREPWSREVSIQRVRPDAPLLPPAVDPTHVAIGTASRAHLARGEGWTVCATRYRDETAYVMVTAVNEQVGEEIVTLATKG